MARGWLRLGALAAAGLAAWLAYDLGRTPAVPSPPAPSADAAQAEFPRLEGAAPALAALRTTLERPLFNADRRPDPLADSGTRADPADPAKALPVRLTAVIVGNDGRRSVLVEIPGQDRPTLVGTGDQVAGWRVEAIDDEAVVLNAGGQRTVVPLRIFDTPVAGKRPAARPAGQRRPEAARRPPAKPAAPEAGAAPAVEGQPPAPAGAAGGPPAQQSPPNKRN